MFAKKHILPFFLSFVLMMSAAAVNPVFVMAEDSGGYESVSDSSDNDNSAATEDNSSTNQESAADDNEKSDQSSDEATSSNELEGEDPDDVTGLDNLVPMTPEIDFDEDGNPVVVHPEIEVSLVENEDDYSDALAAAAAFMPLGTSLDPKEARLADTDITVTTPGGMITVLPTTFNPDNENILFNINTTLSASLTEITVWLETEAATPESVKVWRSNSAFSAKNTELTVSSLVTWFYFDLTNAQLQTGGNYFIVEVTSPDGTTKKEYKLTINRAQTGGGETVTPPGPGGSTYSPSGSLRNHSGGSSVDRPREIIGVHSAQNSINRISVNFSNATTADEILSVVRAALTGGAVANWSENTPFTVVPATATTPGKITGIIMISVENSHSAIVLNVVIPPLQ